jgi:hypothetical protein
MQFFTIQKILKFPSIEKQNDQLDNKFFKQDISKYLTQIKLSMMKNEAESCFLKKNVLYQCYIKSCTKAYGKKKDLVAHLRNHVSYKIT